MADRSSDIYKRAIEAGFTDGLARGFRKELRYFKLYRQLKAPAELWDSI
jgi:hypothetical protein